MPWPTQPDGSTSSVCAHRRHLQSGSGLGDGQPGGPAARPHTGGRAMVAGGRRRRRRARFAAAAPRRRDGGRRRGPRSAPPSARAARRRAGAARPARDGHASSGRCRAQAEDARPALAGALRREPAQRCARSPTRPHAPAGRATGCPHPAPRRAGRSPARLQAASAPAPAGSQVPEKPPTSSARQRLGRPAGAGEDVGDRRPERRPRPRAGRATAPVDGDERRPGLVGRPDLAEPGRAEARDLGEVGQRLDVLDQRRAAVDALLERPRRHDAPASPHRRSG